MKEIRTGKKMLVEATMIVVRNYAWILLIISSKSMHGMQELTIVGKKTNEADAKTQLLATLEKKGFEPLSKAEDLKTASLRRLLAIKESGSPNSPCELTIPDLNELLASIHTSQNLVTTLKIYKALIQPQTFIVKSLPTIVLCPTRNYLFSYDDTHTYIYQLAAFGPELICPAIAGKPLAISTNNKYVALKINKCTQFLDLTTRSLIPTPKDYNCETDMITLTDDGISQVTKNCCSVNECDRKDNVYYFGLWEGLIPPLEDQQLGSHSFLPLNSDNSGMWLDLRKPMLFDSTLKSAFCNYINGFHNGSSSDTDDESYIQHQCAVTPDAKTVLLWKKNERAACQEYPRHHYILSFALLKNSQIKNTNSLSIFSCRTKESFEKVALHPSGRYALIWTGSGYTSTSFPESQIPLDNPKRMLEAFGCTAVHLIDFEKNEAVCILESEPVQDIGFNPDGTFFYILGCFDDFKVYALNSFSKQYSVNTLINNIQLSKFPTSFE